MRHMTVTTPTGMGNFIGLYKTTKNVDEATNLFESGMEAAKQLNVNRLAAAQLALETYAQNPSTSVMDQVVHVVVILKVRLLAMLSPQLLDLPGLSKW